MLATNRTGDLDAAVLDSYDESLPFPLPDEPCRELQASSVDAMVACISLIPSQPSPRRLLLQQLQQARPAPGN